MNDTRSEFQNYTLTSNASQFIVNLNPENQRINNIDLVKQANGSYPGLLSIKSKKDFRSRLDYIREFQFRYEGIVI